MGLVKYRLLAMHQTYHKNIFWGVQLIWVAITLAMHILLHDAVNRLCYWVRFCLASNDNTCIWALSFTDIVACNKAESIIYTTSFLNIGVITFNLTCRINSSYHPSGAMSCKYAGCLEIWVNDICILKNIYFREN